MDLSGRACVCLGVLGGRLRRRRHRRGTGDAQPGSSGPRGAREPAGRSTDRRAGPRDSSGSADVSGTAGFGRPGAPRWRGPRSRGRTSGTAGPIRRRPERRDRERRPPTPLPLGLLDSGGRRRCVVAAHAGLGGGARGGRVLVRPDRTTARVGSRRPGKRVVADVGWRRTRAGHRRLVGGMVLRTPRAGPGMVHAAGGRSHAGVLARRPWTGAARRRRARRADDRHRGPAPQRP